MRIALLLLALPIVADAAPLTEAVIRPTLESAARRALPDSVVEVEIVAVSLRGNVDAPADATFRLRTRGDEDWVGTVPADLDVWSSGAVVGTVPLVLEVVPWVEVPVLRQGVPRGERLHADRIGRARRPLDGLSAGVVLDPARVVGRVAKRDLGLNQPLKDADLEERVDAMRNQPVRIVVARNGLRLTSPGLLREDARIGEAVSVWNEGTKVEQKGVLTAPDTVQLPSLGPVALGNP
jgi:flagella basal body P-ring formation protein FlgA